MSGTTAGAVRVERSGGVGEVVLDRADRRNALDYAAVDQLIAALHELEGDRQVGAILVRGEGRSFCAGGDLEEFQAGTSASAYEFHRSGAGWAELMTMVARLETPVLVAPHGHALAGGCGLVAAADIAIAAAGTQFGTSEITIGMFPIVIYPTLARAIGARSAREWALTGRRVDADEALSAGLVHRVVPADEHLGVARETAAHVASFGEHAMRLGKWFMREVEELPVESATAFARAVRGSFMTTPDLAEGLAAFAEKRPPRFRP